MSSLLDTVIYAQVANCADYRRLSLGPLDKYIKQHQELLDRRDTILNMSAQICSALDFLESKKIFHGDLVSCDKKAHFAQIQHL